MESFWLPVYDLDVTREHPQQKSDSVQIGVLILKTKQLCISQKKCVVLDTTLPYAHLEKVKK